ncbi:MAG: DUF4157 domain-containing protein, partial [Kofleriaceae bacterium]|nr:DUF4157 domain-containing protein [Kofleriaceae bacterium]
AKSLALTTAAATTATGDRQERLSLSGEDTAAGRKLSLSETSDRGADGSHSTAHALQGNLASGNLNVAHTVAGLADGSTTQSLVTAGAVGKHSAGYSLEQASASDGTSSMMHSGNATMGGASQRSIQAAHASRTSADGSTASDASYGLNAGAKSLALTTAAATTATGDRQERLSLSGEDAAAGRKLSLSETSDHGADGSHSTAHALQGNLASGNLNVAHTVAGLADGSTTQSLVTSGAVGQHSAGYSLEQASASDGTSSMMHNATASLRGVEIGGQSSAMSLRDGTTKHQHSLHGTTRGRSASLSADDENGVAFLMDPPPAPSGVAPVQMKRNDDASPAAVTNESVHQAAAVGVSGAGHAVPFADDIQRSFGDHDISHIKAHSDAAALAGSKAMGAGAFASGNKIVLGDKQDKHTVAHEVAHVMQQRAGVQLLGGVGAVGDEYERNADAIAERVVTGQSAVDLLPTKGQASTPVQGLGAVQRAPASTSASTSTSTSTAPQPTNDTIVAPTPGINCSGFIDTSDGANIRTGPQEAGGVPVIATPLPPATRVFVSGTHPTAKAWLYVTAFLPEQIVRGYVQNFRVNTSLPEPLAKLYQIKAGDTAQKLAAREFQGSARDGHDLRYFENVLLHTNKGRAGIKGSMNDPGVFSALTAEAKKNGRASDIELVVGHRIWVVSPSFAKSLEGVVPDASLTNGGLAKAKRFAGHVVDLNRSVIESPNYLAEVAGQYVQIIRDHLPEIIGITAGFIAAEAASAFLAASPTGVGQLAAVLIQLALSAFGAAGMVQASMEAMQHASAWLTTAWTAQGDNAKIALASKEYLQMLIGIAMAALAYIGAKHNMGKAVKISNTMAPIGKAPVPAMAVAAKADNAHGGYGQAADIHVPPTPVPDEILRSQVHQLAPGSKGMDRGGLAILEKSDPHLATVADPVQRVPGWFDVVLHGTDVGEIGDGFRVVVRNPATGVPKVYTLTAAQLAAIIRDSNWRSGMPIRLFACRAGRLMPGGKTAAAELSAALKTEVLASNQVNIDTARGFAAYPMEKSQGTQYTVFSPPTSTLKLNKGATTEMIAQGKGAPSSGTSGSTHGALVPPQLASAQVVPGLLAQYEQRLVQLELLSPVEAARVRSGMRAANSWGQVNQLWQSVSKEVRDVVDRAAGISVLGKP